MKVAYIYQQFTQASGTERVFIDKMNYFAEKQGYEVIMITCQQGDHPIVFPISPKVNHVDLGVRLADLYNYRRIYRFFRQILFHRLFRKRFNQAMVKLQPDIVVCATYYLYIVSAVAKCKLNYSKVLESHIDRRYLYGCKAINKRKWYNRLNDVYESITLKKAAKKYDVLVALNQPDADDWGRYLDTRIILNIVHLNPTKQICNYKSKRVIFVGRYTEQKGIFDLFEIWKIIHPTHPEWQLDLYGSGELQEKLLAEVERLNAKIYLNEQSLNIYEKYLESSVLVLTSFYEPFGLVMPEAMSCGLPVVSFDCPSGPHNIINDGINGFIINNRDINKYVEKLSELMDSEELRSKMGKAARLSSSRFSAEIIMPQWEQLFMELRSDSTCQ